MGKFTKDWGEGETHKKACQMQALNLF